MYQPTQADIDFLNKVDKGYIGIDKPVLKVTRERNDWLSPMQAEIAEGDHLRIDEQPYEPEEL